jgi:hypothetical protein
MQAHLRSADDKGSVRATSIVLLTGSPTLIGNVLTRGSNGALATQDGVTLVVGDIVAVMYEGGAGNPYYSGTASTTNGIYTVTALGSAGAPWQLTRATNFDTTNDVTAGAYFFVSEGTNQGNSQWALMTDDPIVLLTNTPILVSSTAAAGGSLAAGTYYHRITSVVTVDAVDYECATTTELSGTTAGGNLTSNLVWTAYTYATKYKVYRSSVSNTYGATTYLGTTTSASYSDSGAALATGTPPTASALQFSKIGSNAFYSAGNGIDISATVISVLVSGSTTYTANRILYHGSTSTISSNASFLFDGTNLAVGRTSASFLVHIGNTSQIVNQASATENYIGFYKNSVPDYVGSIGTSVPGSGAVNSALVFSNYTGAWAETWRITSAGILQSNGAQTITTSSGALTIVPATYTLIGSGVVGTPAGVCSIQVNSGTTTIGSGIALALNAINGTNNNYAGIAFVDGVGSVVNTISSKITSHGSHIGDLVFGSGSAAWMTIQSGNVGIGTTSPAIKLTVNGASASFIVNNTNVSEANRSGFLINATSASPAVWQFSLTDVDGNSGLSYMGFKSGNVGIGTTAPGAKLHVDDTSGVAALSNLARLSHSGWSSTYFDINWNVLGGKVALQIIDSSSGASGIVLNSDGNVGIGTTAPATTLDISAATGTLRLTSSTGTNISYLSINNTGGTSYVGMESSAGGQFLTGTPAYAMCLASGAGRALCFGVNNSNLIMTIATGGNVGIGTTTPGELLQTSGGNIECLYGTAGSANYIRVRNTDSTNTASHTRCWIYSTGAGGGDPELVWTVGGVISWVAGIDNSDSDKWMLGLNTAVGNAPFLTVTTAGNVGIGTATPLVKLDVGSPVGQTTTAGAAGLIRNYTSADSTPYTQARMIVYGGTGVDTGNWGYLAYGADASMRVVYGKTGSGNNLYWGTSSAMDGTGTFTPNMTLSMAGNLGIGTTTPGAKLDVSGGGVKITGTNPGPEVAGISFGGDATNGGTIRGDGNGGTHDVTILNRSGSVALGVLTGTYNVAIPNGKLCIGMAAPTYTCDITGTLRATSTVNFSGLTASSSITTDGSSNLTATPLLGGTVARAVWYTIGDGAALTYSLSHSFATRNVTVFVYKNSSPWDQWIVDNTRDSTGSVVLTFLTAPGVDAFKACIMA